MIEKLQNFIIGLDFDGTVVSHEYPNIGKYIGAEVVLLKLRDKGVLFVLNTMRSGYELKQAVEWFSSRNIPLYGINENPDQKSWTSSPKVYAHLYIDDAALGAPLIYEKNQRPYIDWEKVNTFIFGEDDV